MRKSIPVLGSIYKIKEVNGLAKDGYDGLCMPTDRLILIDSKYKFSYKQEILYHEVGHAFSDATGLHEILGDQAEEMFCQAFANFICQAFHGGRNVR